MRRPQSAPSTGSESIKLGRAAQYLRTSCHNQEYSTANQSAAIALYAAAHQLGIIRSFVDEGRSGRTIEHRQGLQELLRVVASGTADFQHILVYDVSRWGRFSDSDEAAYYEFLCKRTGISVHYCAEHFSDDNTLASNVMKALKRAMAAEFSRESGVRTAAGKRRVASMGFWHGGLPPFGFERVLVNQNGEHKRFPSHREWKRTSTDHVLLAPGPKKAVGTIRLAFDLYTERGRSRNEIVSILNDQRWFLGRRPWNTSMLGALFTNPIYKGVFVFGKYNAKRGNHNLQPADKWLCIENALPRIISDLQWSKANARIAAAARPFRDADMLDDLRRLWHREGKLNTKLINGAKDIARAPTYCQHFGSLTAAYDLIGYQCTRQHKNGAIGRVRRMRDELCVDLCKRIQIAGGSAEHRESFLGTRARGLLVVNGNITVQITFSTASFVRGSKDIVSWVLSIGEKRTCDIVVVICFHPGDLSIKDYYVVPAIAQVRGKLALPEASRAPFLDPYHFDSLEELVTFLGRFRLEVA